MEKIGYLTQSFEEARVWIRSVFQRFGSPFSERKAHLHNSEYSTDFYSINKSYKSVPEVLTLLTDRSPKATREKRDIEGAASTSEKYDNISHTLSAAADEQMRNISPDTRRRSSSLSVLEVGSHSFLGKMKFKCDLDGEIAPKTFTEIGKTNNAAFSSKLEPCDSGVHSEQSIDTICRSNLEKNGSIDRENAGKTNEENAKEQSTSNQNEKERNMTEDQFSKINSMFCEKLNTIQNKGKAISEQEDGEKDKSHEMFQTERKISTVLSETHQPKLIGRIHLSMQYFQKSRQLRVILLSAESSVGDTSKLFCKVTLNGNGSRQKKKTHKIKSKSGIAEFKETFYMETEKDHLTGYLLRAQLCTLSTSTCLKRSRPVGEVIIPCEDIDLAFETSLWVQLRDPKSLDKLSIDKKAKIYAANWSVYDPLRESDDVDIFCSNFVLTLYLLEENIYVYL